MDEDDGRRPLANQYPIRTSVWGLFHINRTTVLPCDLPQASGPAADRKQNSIPHVDFH